MMRNGSRHDPDPRASEPATFAYSLFEGAHIESWGEGLEVFHNPRAIIPLPRGYFPDAADHALKGGVLHSFVPDFHPFTSAMVNAAISGFELSRELMGETVDSIRKREFDELMLRRVPLPPIWIEREWLADRSRTVLATVVEDTVDNDWAVAVVAPRGEFVTSAAGIATRDEARTWAIEQVAKTVRANRSQQ